jgi:sugar phosphate isomerase/epimerase
MAVQANTPIMAEVGEGNLNWEAILAACREAGVLWYIVEQDVCQRDPFESLGISLRNLRSMGLQ